eukprot:TRINITY_DN5459_c0_g1_i1.p1 TRINITY_DN5459_c0_g1~~TRINITY_DN5459_c0_g1_i1.p1  ORF type:complete len:514 (+),score=123.47 TRINITY_DN5459_c0_g1_i1:40-1542(+)
MSNQNLPQEIWTFLNENPEPFTTLAYAEKNNLDHQLVVGAVKSLSAQDLVKLTQNSRTKIELTEEGKTVLTKGSPEFRLFLLLEEPKEKTDPKLSQVFENAKDLQIAITKGITLGLFQIKKVENKQLLERKKSKEETTDITKDLLVHVKSGQTIDDKAQTELKKRQLIHNVKITEFKVEKGDNFSVGLVTWATELTQEMLATDSWKNVTFKKYNFETLGLEITSGHLHPLMKVRSEFRQIFLELGYEEMPTDNYVESSFWNFDALYQPQQHPSRDAHDTFFLKEPGQALTIPQDYMERVKVMHSSGGSGSFGWRYDWKEAEARKNVLRTHTTAVSSRMLYLLAKQEKFVPKKYFSIDKVFRNEALDATHLAEFHQIEGVVADYDLTLGDLIGSISQYFEKIGLTDLEFKPAYNPYTEPSMEVFAYHPLLKRKVEIGNSGLFRPEMLIPMGLPENVRVFGLGLSLERPTMIKYGIDNIRKLVGHKVDLKFVETNPICRLEK